MLIITIIIIIINISIELRREQVKHNSPMVTSSTGHLPNIMQGDNLLYNNIYLQLMLAQCDASLTGK